MRIFQVCARAGLLWLALGISSFGQTSTNGTLTGQWDFNDGTLKATVGTDLQYIGDTATKTTFGSVVVNGPLGNVMNFEPLDPTEGYLMYHGAQPNGGGTNVNVYTIVMDLFWPAESDQTFRTLFNSDTNNVQDATMYVNPDNAIGVDNDYAGEMDAETWYRLAIVVDLPNNVISKYLNGTNIEDQVLTGNAIDSKFSLGPALLLFSDPTDATAKGSVDKIQFYSDALTADQVAALGVPVGDAGPPITGDVTIQSIQKSGANVIITVNGSGTLQLQQKSKLTDANWQNIGQPTTGTTFTVPAADPTAFFRVERLQ